MRVTYELCGTERATVRERTGGAGCGAAIGPGVSSWGVCLRPRERLGRGRSPGKKRARCVSRHTSRVVSRWGRTGIRRCHSGVSGSRRYTRYGCPRDGRDTGGTRDTAVERCGARVEQRARESTRGEGGYRGSVGERESARDVGADGRGARPESSRALSDPPPYTEKKRIRGSASLIAVSRCSPCSPTPHAISRE